MTSVKDIQTTGREHTLERVKTNESDRELMQLWLGTKTSTRTRQEYSRDIARFLSSLKPGVTLKSLTASHVLHFKESLEQPNEKGKVLKENTVKRYMGVVKSLLSFAHQTGYTSFNVGAVFKNKSGLNERAQRCLSELEVLQLVNGAKSERDKLLLRVLYTTGIRVSELTALRWCDLQERSSAGQLTVLGKGNKTRAVLVPQALWNDLMRFKEQSHTNDSLPVFKSRQRSSDGTYHLSSSTVNRIVKGAAKGAGVEKEVSPHWMRHSHASHSLERGASIALVSETLGHSNISTTSVYIHARPSESSSTYLLAV